MISPDDWEEFFDDDEELEEYTEEEWDFMIDTLGKVVSEVLDKGKDK